jgi:hypothetical protein
LRTKYSRFSCRDGYSGGSAPLSAATLLGCPVSVYRGERIAADDRGTIDRPLPEHGFVFKLP